MQISSVVSGRGEVATRLVWCEPGGVHTLNKADFRGMSLREKVFVMQQVNLFLERLIDGGEASGGGDDIHSPLLLRS